MRDFDDLVRSFDDHDRVAVIIKALIATDASTRRVAQRPGQTGENGGSRKEVGESPRR
jgi:hypothetical protein